MRESRPLSKLLGQSWRTLHSPLLFRWARALQPSPNHWPEGVQESFSGVDVEVLRDIRRELTNSSKVLPHRDLGAGSRIRGGRKPQEKRVGEMAQSSLTPQSDLEALCRWLSVISNRGSMLELGTSFGLTAAAVSQLGWKVETWEGCPVTLDIAKDVWQRVGSASSIVARLGDFRELLPQVAEGAKWDVAFLDGLHEEQATLELADALAPHVEVCLVVDDIAWSPGMHRAWLALQDRPEWRVSFSWRGRGFLLKAPQMSRQKFCLA